MLGKARKNYKRDMMMERYISGICEPTPIFNVTCYMLAEA